MTHNRAVEGDDVWIPMASILGGQEKCGEGWKMFVECLAEGRGVSLPAGSVAAARLLASSVGAYSRVRKQFKVPIAEFGGVQEALARIGSQGLICIAGADLMNAIVDNHEAPMVGQQRRQHHAAGNSGQGREARQGGRGLG